MAESCQASDSHSLACHSMCYAGIPSDYHGAVPIFSVDVWMRCWGADSVDQSQSNLISPDLLDEFRGLTELRGKHAGLQKFDQVMMDLGHEWVDLLKIDIETSEWELFSDFYAVEGATLPATQARIIS